jgi:hypothetical protein
VIRYDVHRSGLLARPGAKVEHEADTYLKSGRDSPFHK